MLAKITAISCAVLVFLITQTGCGPQKPRQSETGAVPPGTQAQLPDTFSVAFYNVENLFDFENDGSEYPEYKPGAANWTHETFAVKLKNISSVIAALNPEIIALCEVEDMDAVEALKKQLRKAGLQLAHTVIGDKPNETNTSPVVLSRFPVLSQKGYGVSPPDVRASRNILEVTFDIGGAPLTLFVNHWPSKQHPASHRIVAAKALREGIERLPPGTDYIILGDFNEDHDEYAKFKTLGLDNTGGITGLNHLLGTVRKVHDRHLYVNETMLQSLSDIAHYDLWHELPAPSRMSYYYRGNRQTPDHLLLPRALYDSTGISYVDNSFEVFTWDGKLLRGNQPFRWQMRFRGKQRFHVGEGYSDHLPLRARFTRRPFAFDTSGQPGIQPQTNLHGDGIGRAVDGWVGCNARIVVTRDTVTGAVPHQRYCLWIKGGPLKSHGCAARAVLHPPRAAKKVRFDLRGSGNLTIRIRSPGGKWRYYNGPDFSQSGSARYAAQKLPSWKPITLQLPPAKGDIEMEFRAGRDLPFSFGIDNVTFE